MNKMGKPVFTSAARHIIIQALALY